MDIYKELANLIDNAVKINRENRLRFNDMREQMGPVQYAMQMCTVEINVGRAVGYSTYIKRKFDDAVRACDLPLDLIVVANEEVRRHMFREIPTVFTIDQVLRGVTYPRGTMKPMLFDRVYVDEPSLCFRREEYRTDMYAQLIAGGNHPTFILLGR